MTAQQTLVGLTSNKRLGTYGTWTAVILGLLFVVFLGYQVAKAAALVR